MKNTRINRTYQYSLLPPARLRPDGTTVELRHENRKVDDLHIYSESRKSFGSPVAERAMQFTVKGQIVARFHIFQHNGKANLQLCQFPNGSLQYVNQANIQAKFVGSADAIKIKGKHV
jgi:hypothetical protein